LLTRLAAKKAVRGTDEAGDGRSSWVREELLLRKKKTFAGLNID
jgi:hypothetical protein